MKNTRGGSVIEQQLQMGFLGRLLRGGNPHVCMEGQLCEGRGGVWGSKDKSGGGQT